MDNYKPYSFLIKQESSPASLTCCFVVIIPAGKKLGEPSKTVLRDVTTFTYQVLNDPTQLHARQEEYENKISWDGKLHYIKVIIGSGSGGDGGTGEISSNGGFL